MDTGMPSDDRAHATILDNLGRVRAAVSEACQRAGRRDAEVRLVAVTKQAPVEAAAWLFQAGQHDLGEGRPQGLWEKAAAVPQARWHLVGRLQRNKVRRTLPLLALLHSLDSLRLLEAIDAEAVDAGRACEALVEVNLDGDPRRGGLAPAEVAGLLAATPAHVHIRGLMGMASVPRAGGPAGEARRQFAGLRALRDRLAADHPGLVELSMGMSGDFVEAIAEGSTIVRIGSALWEGLPANGRG